MLLGRYPDRRKVENRLAVQETKLALTLQPDEVKTLLTTLSC